jgi:hypothetical protein
MTSARGKHGEALTSVGEHQLAAEGWRTDTPEAPTPSLGHTERTCNNCQASWEMGQAACSKCGSTIFDEKYVKPTPFEFGPLGKIRQLLKPDKPETLPLTAFAVVKLRRAAEDLRSCIASLAEADAVARGEVNAGTGKRETIGYLQAKLAAASSTAGDFSLENLKPLIPSMRALGNLIETTLEKENAK